MSFLSKMKDILFDEEDVIVEGNKEEEKKPVITKEVEIPKIEKIEVPAAPVVEDTLEMPSPFMDFDEDEFESSIPKIPNVEQSRQKKPNVVEYERTKTVEKRYDYGRYEKVETTEIKEKKKFKPSLIISPVYGVLNEDYKPEDIKHREETYSGLNIDEVRKKAYGEIKEEEEIPTYVKTTITTYKEKPKEQESVEDLLTRSSDYDFLVEDEEELDVKDDNYNTFNEYDNFDVTSEIEIPREVSKKKETTRVYEDDEDTLESDLFDLIDSMYESKEENI